MPVERQTELVARLTLLRRTVRRRLTGYGLCAVLAGGVVSFLTVVSLDWLLDLPWPLRMVVAVLFFAGFVAAAFHWIIKPLRAPLTLDEIAGRIERRFPELRDRLSSAVSFVQRPDAGSPSMVDEVIVRAEESVRSLPLSSVLSARPVMTRVVWLVVAASALVITLAVVPSFLRTGLARYVDPLSDVEWPRTVSINPLTADLVAAAGEPVDVRMSVERGLTDTLRAVVRLRETDGTRTALAMRRVAPGVFSATVDAVTRDLDYWFEAGDDSTEGRPSRIRVVLRPAVVEVTATAHPPGYASDRPSSTHDMRDGPLPVVIGATVEMAVRASKSIVVRSGADDVGLRLADGSLIPLAVNGTTSTDLHAAIRIDHDVAFHVELRDEDGFANRGAEAFELRAVTDAPPIVNIIEPQAVTEITPTGTIPIAARVDDDFGVRAVQLGARRLSGEPLFVHELDVKATPGGSARVEVAVAYDWAIEPLKLAPGDTFAFTIDATDNRRLTDDDTGQAASSALMRVKIISEIEFEARLRSDLAVLESRLRQLSLDQGELLNRTEALGDEAAGDEPISDTSRIAAAQNAGAQTRIVRPLRGAAQRFVQLADRMFQNNAGDPDTRSQLREEGELLRDTALGPAAAAASALRKASEHSDAPAQREALTVSAADQRQVVDELQKVLRSVAQWGGFQGLMTRTKDLLERQESLRARTGELGKRTLGKPVESLSPGETAALKSLAGEQKQINSDVDELLRRMIRERDASMAKDAAAAEAIDEAVRSAQANDLSSRLRAAADAVEQNRAVGATVEQKGVAQAMRKMIAALRARRDRELAELRKTLTDAIEQVAALIEEQTLLHDATREAGAVNAGAEAFDALEAEQRRIRGNTNALADEFATAERLAAHAPTLHDAAAAMRDAEGELRVASSGSSESAEQRAIELLTAVRDNLDEEARQAENEAFRRTLAEMREHLEGIRDAEREIVDGIDVIRADVEREGRLGRSQAREAVRLSRAQGDVRAQVAEVLPELERVIVYRWALERVAGWMERVQTSLYARNVGDEVADTAKRALAEVEKLIGALVETEALPLDTDFVESDSSGASGGQTGAPTAVPTVAELLVLKTLQVDVNQRTRSLAEPSNGGDATEAQLRQIKAVGEDQAEIRRLAELVTRRARQ